ncbi:DNA transposition protein, AAA+ family ATPase [Flavobacterium johnsoniae]|uniref:DNA transposition protein, AAA+ family ATPase n=2 Tax=Flavobacterium johnsoniae TaxID=986 RepID=A0A1M5WCD6_FLAJO|nr:DNA transposition protein, AAA+ family ATPase [Flavobacterium johnsoniae]
MTKIMKNQLLQQEVAEMLSNFLEQKQISQNKLAEMIGVSSATISNIINEFWERVNETMLLKIKAYFKTKDWTLIKTSNFTTVQDACDTARKRRTMIGIIGYAGAGKTTALQNYYESNANTYMVTCMRGVRTKQLLSDILKALGVNYLASDVEMIRTIIGELNKKDGALLIIDEASKLSANALMYIQDILDGIEGGAGIIIAGVEYLLENLKKGVDKKKMGMPEFYTRVALWHHLTGPTRKEIETICVNNGLTDKQIIRDVTRLNDFRQVRNSILNFETA